MRNVGVDYSPYTMVEGTTMLMEGSSVMGEAGSAGEPEDHGGFDSMDDFMTPQMKDNLQELQDKGLLATPMHTGQYYEPSGKIIPFTRVQETTATLATAGALIKQSDAEFSRILRSTNDYHKAKKAQDAILPGGKTKLFDDLTEAGHLLNVTVIGPPVTPPIMTRKMSMKDYEEQYRYNCYDVQNKVHDLVLRMNIGMQGLVVDVFASRSVNTYKGEAASETNIRFPSYYASTVDTLVHQLNMVDIGQFRIKAFYMGTGRSVVNKYQERKQRRQPYNATISGVPVPHLSSVDAKQARGKIKMQTLCDKLSQVINMGKTLQDEEKLHMMQLTSEQIATSSDFKIERRISKFREDDLR